ncbi:MAG: hypothetical protein ACI4JM_00335, partial [Oscillospiraceae bacterium]
WRSKKFFVKLFPKKVCANKVRRIADMKYQQTGDRWSPLQKLNHRTHVTYNSLSYGSTVCNAMEMATCRFFQKDLIF